MMMEYILSTALAKEYLKEFNSGVKTDVIIAIKVELGTELSHVHVHTGDV